MFEILCTTIDERQAKMNILHNVNNASLPELYNDTDMKNVIVYEAALATVLTICVISSCLFNIIIIIVFMRFKCLRTKHDMLVINLAFTNLIITVGISFYSTYTIEPGDIFHQKVVCMGLFICIFGGILTSLLVLLLLSLERFLCIVYPRFHGRIRIRHVILCSILAYLVGLSYAIIPFILKNNWDRYHLCVLDVFPFEFSIAEQVSGIVIITTIVTINVLVYKTALSQAAKINVLLKNVQHRHTRSRKLRQKGKAFVTVFLLSGISAVCWIPLLVVFALESDPNLPEKFRWIFTQLLYVPVAVNSSVTAIIIGHRNRHFRDAIKSMYCRKQHECIQNSTYTF